jgi:hypothetical protein
MNVNASVAVRLSQRPVNVSDLGWNRDERETRRSEDGRKTFIEPAGPPDSINESPNNRPFWRVELTDRWRDLKESGPDAIALQDLGTGARRTVDKLLNYFSLTAPALFDLSVEVTPYVDFPGADEHNILLLERDAEESKGGIPSESTLEQGAQFSVTSKPMERHRTKAQYEAVTLVVQHKGMAVPDDDESASWPAGTPQQPSVQADSRGNRLRVGTQLRRHACPCGLARHETMKGTQMNCCRDPLTCFAITRSGLATPCRSTIRLISGRLPKAMQSS